ncbi:MAG: O-acetyl-ADP-ribose deacetylase [Candidatus Altiarchaeales archaeon ex4484_43]|nr:MAG: O-acetyl-ADP-ribose deacetylase [Candidatus Altiarchaeales archaeon ex4484_43]RLI89510.1 MAG: macro domain-containing protein [Candidatus Altiarchaeales archaeon]
MISEIIIRKGDITKERVDAIVNPANSRGTMGGGVAGAIKGAGGDEIEREAIEHAPIKVGEAIATTAGKLPADFVIHAPTMEMPAQKISIENVERATYGALECAKNLGIKSIAFPGMGTGVGGVAKEDAAKCMVNTIRRFLNTEKPNLSTIVLVGFDNELVKEFRESLKNAEI